MTATEVLGLPTREALALLRQGGYREIAICRTHAPKREQLEGEERVVAVRDGGKTLVVSRFLTGSPRSE